MKKGQPRIKVKFMVDVNGIMNVEATEESTNKQNKILIENKKGRLNNDDIEKMLKESERYREKDIMIMQKIEARNKLDCYINSAKNSLDTSEIKIKLGEEKYSNTINIINNIENWFDESEDITSITKDDYDNKYKELENNLIPIFKIIME